MAATSIASGKPRTRRWRGLQFGLRSLLGLMVAACLVMGAWRAWIHPYEEQRLALAEVAPLAEHIDTEPGRPAWLGRFFAPETFRDVTHLAFDGKGKFTNAHLAHLARFPRLNRLSLDHTSISDAGLAHLAGLSHLDTLSLNNTRITGAGLAHLRGLKNLKRLELGHTEVKGAELDVLAGMRLEILELDNLAIEDEHVQSLASLKELQTLSLHASRIRGPGVQSLQCLPKLAKLALASERLESIDLARFESLEELAAR